MPRFDVHQHLYPPALIEALRARREPPRLDGDRLELREGSFPFDEGAHDLDARLAVLDESEIDVAVISLPPTLETEEHPELEAAYNEGAAELVAAAEGRLRAFAARACLDGFAGACVSAGAAVRGLAGLPGELSEAGQVLFVHPGPPAALPPGAPPWWAAVVDYPAQMQAAYLAWLAGDASDTRASPPSSPFSVGVGPFSSSGCSCAAPARRRKPARTPTSTRRRTAHARWSSASPPAAPDGSSSGATSPSSPSTRPCRPWRSWARMCSQRSRQTTRPASSRDRSPHPSRAAPPSLAPGHDLWLKREDVHELGAFKWRGALPVLTAYNEAGADGVVTASTGNHGAAAAWAAERLGLRVVVFAPEDATRAKVDLIEALGAELRLEGADFDQAKDEARRFAGSEGLPFFEDGAERAQYEGYGAIAREIVEQLEEPPAVVVVPVGNGALFGGIGLHLAKEAPRTARVGVAPKEAPVMVESWRAGHVVESTRCATFADGLGVRVAIPLAVDVLADVASHMLLVSEREMALALGAYAGAGLRVEGAAAAALAAVPQLDDVDGPIVLVLTGRNIDDDLFMRATTRPETFPD